MGTVEPNRAGAPLRPRRASVRCFTVGVRQTPASREQLWAMVHAGRAAPADDQDALDLTMAMAGRAVFCDELWGDGVAVLRERMPAAR